MSPRIEVNYWAEGPTDRAAARKLILTAGGEPGADYSTRRGASPGKDFLETRLPSFNQAAAHSCWLILRDSDGVCAAQLRKRILPAPSDKMCFHIVVPAIEAWLLADREAFAKEIGVAVSRIADTPEQFGDVKGAVIALARQSKRRDIQKDLLPRKGSRRNEGPGYAQFLTSFIDTEWSPPRAKAGAPSLARAMDRLSRLLAAK